MTTIRMGLAALLWAVPTALSAAELVPYFSGERILVDATINEQPARFLFDTGATFSALFEPAVERLQVEAESSRQGSIAGHQVEIGTSEPFELAMFGQQASVQLSILPFPPPAGCDGALSWRNLSAQRLLIDGYERKISTPAELPQTDWQRWQIDNDSQQLFFLVTHDGQPLGRVFVDTGAAFGLRLSPSLWKAWRQQHPDAATTLETFQYVVGEPDVYEVAWAQRYQLGDLTLHQVDIGPIPAVKGDTALDVTGEEFIATLGIRALRHLRLLISLPTGEVLTQTVSPVPAHNRLGAVFVRSSAKSSELVARVLANSPASAAGLQDGDVLLAINGTSFSNEEAGARKSPEPFFTMPAGTELTIEVKRGEAVHKVTAMLRDLVP